MLFAYKFDRTKWWCKLTQPSMFEIPTYTTVDATSTHIC